MLLRWVLQAIYNIRARTVYQIYRNSTWQPRIWKSDTTFSLSKLISKRIVHASHENTLDSKGIQTYTHHTTTLSTVNVHASHENTVDSKHIQTTTLYISVASSLNACVLLIFNYSDYTRVISWKRMSEKKRQN